MLVERGKYHNGLINSKTVTLEIKRLVTNTLSYNTRGAEIGHNNKKENNCLEHISTSCLRLDSKAILEQ